MAKRETGESGSKNPMAYPGPGRPSKLTQSLLESICKARALGMSVVRACRVHYINTDTYYEWLNRGKTEKSEGKRSIFVEFSDRVPVEDARGEYFLLSKIHGVLATGSDKAAGKRSPSQGQLAAAKIALATLATIYSGRYGANRRFGKTEKGEAEGSGKALAESLDLSVYTAEEREQLRQLILKGRQALEKKEPR